MTVLAVKYPLQEVVLGSVGGRRATVIARRAAAPGE